MTPTRRCLVAVAAIEMCLAVAAARAATPTGAQASDQDKVMVVRPDGRLVSGTLASPAMQAEVMRQAPVAAPGTIILMHDGVLHITAGQAGAGSLADRIARSLGG